MCVGVRERERERECVCERESECVCVRAYPSAQPERSHVRESVCV